MIKASELQRFVKFGCVGASGYAVNLAVYAVLADVLGADYLVAAATSFLVAAASNYALHRLWTFRAERAGVIDQGWRFLFVSVGALALNLIVLRALVEFGMPKMAAQLIAVAASMPFNYLGNRLWSFRTTQRTVAGCTTQPTTSLGRNA